MTKIPDIYEKIGSVLKEMRSNPTAKSPFTTEDVYDLYVLRYPEDETFMRECPGHSLRGYLNGMMSEYPKKTNFHNSERPAIMRVEGVEDMTYCFVVGT